MDDSYTSQAVEGAMKALSKLFEDTGGNDSTQDNISAHNVLMGLSSLFRKIAMASQVNPADGLELGLMNGISGKLLPAKVLISDRRRAQGINRRR